jgi:hypothetical protein
MADYFTELFSAIRPIDVGYSSFTFIPDGSSDFYHCCQEHVTDFFVTPTDETDLILPSDSYIEIILPTDVTIPLFGVNYDRLYVGSNGYITFGSGDVSHVPTLANHFSLPRISGIFSDFGALGGSSVGSVYFLELDDKIVITYKDVRHYPGSAGMSVDPNDFQIEMFFDGRVRLTYLRAAVTTGVIGLSRGGGVPFGFTDSDFSAYDIMPAAPESLEAGGITENKVRLHWLDISDFDVAFIIERKGPNEEFFSQIGTILTSETEGITFDRYVTYIDENLLPSTQYVYRVLAANKNCLSDPSNEATTQTRPIPSPAPTPSPISFIIHPIKVNETDQLSIGARLFMRQKNRQWNQQIGSEWCVEKIEEGNPRKITIKPIEPMHAESEWTVTEPQLREHFSLTPDVPGPPSKIVHLNG